MVDGKSENILNEKLNKLKEIIPEAFADGKVDWEKLKATLGEDINFENERYNLNWAGKSDAFRVLQQRTSATLKPVPEESYPVEFSPLTKGGDKEGVQEVSNIFIEGENLDVLKVLQKSYFGKIKMIYIDPPYNTGNDSFIYPDKFSESKDEYLKRIGDKSEEGYLLKEGFFRKNSKDSGHYHSNWLSMMYPRLYIARNLLRDDGVIFVSIDDNEVHNLRMIMNEIFGEENFVAQIVWQKKTGAGAKTKGYITLHEYILCYSKNFQDLEIEIPYSKKTRSIFNKKDEYYEKLGPYATWPLDTTSMDERKNLRFPIYHSGKEIWPQKQWLWSKDKVEKAQKENKLVFNFNESSGTYSVRFKRYLKEEDGSERKGKPLSIFIGPYTQEGTKNFEGVFDERDIFPFPKPVEFIKRLINIFINGTLTNEDIFLDFFAGSGTTAQAVLELNKEDGGNRKFVLVQLPEKTAEDSEAYKAGFKTIADICKERIRRVIKKLTESHPELVSGSTTQTKLELTEDHSELDSESQGKHGFQVFKLSPSNFKHWRSDLIESEEDLNKMIDLFDSQLKPEAQELNMLYELMLKSGYTLTDKIEQKEGFYLVADKPVVVLSKIVQTIIDEILKVKPQTCIILDNLFAENDQLKTNTALQMKDAGVELITI